MRYRKLYSRSFLTVLAACLTTVAVSCMHVEGTEPYPPSNIIEKVTFTPVSSIVRRAVGSDNWPITWADDDNLYASYGDGRGFQPFTKRKLSQGFAKIVGPGDNFRGINIRSHSGERTGNGPSGAKASGMLMVQGILYMWTRNTGNSTILWSADHAKTWHWGFRFTTSFGCPTFLNFGRNYEGAADRYVYIYSQDGPSAYESYNDVVMARVPKERIRERAAYQFFKELDSSGNAVWTADIRERGSVFSHRGRCQRMDVVYNPGIKRYLMAQGFNHDGGWGIFEAPQPWGPWATVFYTERWDCGSTHGYRLPSKWISKDGRTMYLLFSGKGEYDAFCVRKMSLILRQR